HVVSHPIQYFAPLYRALAQRDDVTLTVYFRSDESARPHVDREFGTEVAWPGSLLEGYDYRFLPSACAAPLDGLGRRLNLDVVRAATSPSAYDAVWPHG